MEQHLKHIKYLESLLSKEAPQSNEWWNIKNKLDQVRIAWAQAYNMAVIARSNLGSIRPDENTIKTLYEDIDFMQENFYLKLTAPLTLGLKESYESKKSKKSEKEQILEQEV